MRLRGVTIEDTFAEAFTMRVARVVITAASARWAREAARSMTGFATSVIGCKCEAGVERELGDEETPDGRPGISVLLFTMDTESLSPVGARRSCPSSTTSVPLLITKRGVSNIRVISASRL